MKVQILDSRQLKAEAKRLGFSHVGLAPAERVPDDVVSDYEEWLEAGRQGEMHYMENHLELRRDPRLLLDGARTVVSLAMSYHPGEGPTQKGIAWYAQGRDYHEVIRQRLQQLMKIISPLGGTEGARICVDTAPVMEKYWAWRCGLGWIGRNRQLVIPGEGSAFFLCELLLTREADCYDTPLFDNPMFAGCGNCRRCLEACPTGALSESGLDARRCLSYLTIEHRGELPDDVRPLLSECFYGCDRCLRACPHLAKAKGTPVEEFRPSPSLLEMTPEDWQRLSPEQYRELFRGSAVKRAKYEGLRRNLGLDASSSE
ncbi:MAG: tRNA epoxyqueuosine(34) reductase QueG [Bacteroidaceae bacterium]|nr:tRNA epoxyqueuosine(34) reductase QueG [Bacteroidaceae bacterium]